MSTDSKLASPAALDRLKEAERADGRTVRELAPGVIVVLPSQAAADAEGAR
jgi:hypothetical protein